MVNLIIFETSRILRILKYELARIAKTVLVLWLYERQEEESDWALKRGRIVEDFRDIRRWTPIRRANTADTA